MIKEIPLSARLGIAFLVVQSNMPSFVSRPKNAEPPKPTAITMNHPVLRGDINQFVVNDAKVNVDEPWIYKPDNVGIISGWVHEDKDGDGVKDDNEPWLGASLNLHDQNGSLIATTNSSPNTGFYQLYPLSGGSYVIFLNPKNGYHTHSPECPPNRYISLAPEEHEVANFCFVRDESTSTPTSTSTHTPTETHTPTSTPTSTDTTTPTPTDTP
ncbi:hypothetical protein HYT02_03965, partial [Candidatus Gottesmanbacteria bacterium]|nr:hypothetical protein [Candidatus Gottesmanbacteria bacterium]